MADVLIVNSHTKMLLPQAGQRILDRNASNASVQLTWD